MQFSLFPYFLMKKYYESNHFYSSVTLDCIRALRFLLKGRKSLASSMGLIPCRLREGHLFYISTIEKLCLIILGVMGRTVRNNMSLTSFRIMV